MEETAVTLGEVYRLCKSIESAVIAQNGRVSANTTAIAVLQAQQENFKDEAKTHGRNWGAGAGAVGGLFGGFVAGFFSGWGGK